MKPTFILGALALLIALTARSVVPEYSVENGVIRIQSVGPDNPILYDNDFWTDVPDAAYLWAKASLGEAKLVANTITRCPFRPTLREPPQGNGRGILPHHEAA